MLYQIESWLTGKVLFESDEVSLKLCVELAISKKVSLNYAKLNYAELNCAKLNRAELNYAELNGAELNDAELNGAELNHAKLNRAELNRAELNRAELNGAKLNHAELNYAELNYAKLNYAELTGTELNGAKLKGAELIRIDGLCYSVIITKSHVHIGCKRFMIDEFRSLDITNVNCIREAKAQFPVVIAILDAIKPYQENSRAR